MERVILEALPENIQNIIGVTPRNSSRPGKIRIREGRPLMVYSSGKSQYCAMMGDLPFLHGPIGYLQDKRILQRISNYSI